MDGGEEEEEEEEDSEIYEIVEVVRSSFVRALLVFPPKESSTTESRRTELDEGLTKVSCNPCVV